MRSRVGSRLSDWLARRSRRRPRSVHRPLERERIRKRDGVLAAVVGELAVMAVDMAMLVPMKRETANTGTPARRAKVAYVCRRS
jgi:hypothetical protein